MNEIWPPQLPTSAFACNPIKINLNAPNTYAFNGALESLQTATHRSNNEEYDPHYNFLCIIMKRLLMPDKQAASARDKIEINFTLCGQGHYDIKKGVEQ